MRAQFRTAQSRFLLDFFIFELQRERDRELLTCPIQANATFGTSGAVGV